MWYACNSCDAIELKWGDCERPFITLYALRRIQLLLNFQLRAMTYQKGMSHTRSSKPLLLLSHRRYPSHPLVLQPLLYCMADKTLRSRKGRPRRLGMQRPSWSSEANEELIHP